MRLLALLALGWFAGILSPARATTVARHLPPYFTGTNAFEVVLEVTPDADTLIFAVEELPPAGWRVTDLTEGGAADGAVLKWGPFVGTRPQSLRYRLAAVPGAVRGTFHGIVASDAGQSEVAGDQQLDRFVGLATRTLPPSYLPGVPLAVGIAVIVAPESRAWAIEEELPPGWIPSLLSPGGVWDPSTRRIKWGVYADPLARTFTYQVTPPMADREPRQFQGQAQIGTSMVDIQGASRLLIEPSRLTRRLPAAYVAGESVSIEIDCQPAAYIGIHAVEETPPSGVPVESIDHSGVLDVQTGKIKWGPFTDRAPKTLGYRLRPGAGQRGALSFAGAGFFDTTDLPIAGPAELVRSETSTSTSCKRSVAATYIPGQPLTVHLGLRVADGAVTVAVEETVPVGWTVGAITQGGVFDLSNHQVKWLWPPGTNGADLAYTVTPPADAVAAGEFAGRVQVDLESLPIGGANRVELLPSAVVRSLPASYVPGTPLELLLDSKPSPITRAYAVEETLPADWTLVTVDGGGTLDPDRRRLKWGPFTDSIPRRFRALILPPANATGMVSFVGLGFFDSQPTITTGPDRVVRSTVDVPSAPKATPDVAQYVVNRPATIPVSALLANDSDSAGAALRVAAVDAQSLRGGTVRIEGASIVYTPAPGFGGLDLFNYRITNVLGGTASSRVLLYPLSDGVTPTDRLAEIQALATGEVRLRFAAIPGLSYGIQGLEKLGEEGWKLFANRIAGPDGQVEFVDPDTVGRVARFYQAVPQ